MIFWYISFSKAQTVWEKQSDGSLILATILDDTWNVFNMQHITLNLKNRIIQTSLALELERSKGPTHMIEVGHHLRNTHPTPTHFWASDDTVVWQCFCVKNVSVRKVWGLMMVKDIDTCWECYFEGAWLLISLGWNWLISGIHICIFLIDIKYIIWIWYSNFEIYFLVSFNQKQVSSQYIVRNIPTLVIMTNTICPKSRPNKSDFEWCEILGCLMPLFHWPAMPRCSYGVRKN